MAALESCILRPGQQVCFGESQLLVCGVPCRPAVGTKLRFEQDLRVRIVPGAGHINTALLLGIRQAEVCEIVCRADEEAELGLALEEGSVVSFSQVFPDQKALICFH